MQVLDSATRLRETMGYMHYAPFIGTPSVSKEGPRGGSPLYRNVCAMVDKLNQVWSGKERPPWSSTVTFEDVRRCAKCAEGLANESARQVSTSYFKSAIMLMDKFMEPIRREVAGGGAIPAGGSGLLDAEATLEFHRLYSAIFFLTNMTEDDGEPQDHEVFGDGLSWGGCVFIHVLGQHSRFNGTQMATLLPSIASRCLYQPAKAIRHHHHVHRDFIAGTFAPHSAGLLLPAGQDHGSVRGAPARPGGAG
eukprot:COSAG06_NODE_4742_length_3989_cov_2.505398_2_plen_250_part_00